VSCGGINTGRAAGRDERATGRAQGQFVAELEERHKVWDQPGKLKLLYWLTRGNLGTYLDAIALGAATGQTPSTGAVRIF
jgi:hypothetical protein